MRTDTEQGCKERVLAVLQHIHAHLDDALSLEELAGIACFSPFHFHRIFRGMVGESIMEHVRRIRLERAAHRLRHGEEPVTRIAFEAGYETHESFTRAFRAMFGEAPSRYRNAHGPLTKTAARCGVVYTPGGRIEDFIPVRTGGASMEVRIEQVAPMTAACIRHIGPYNQIGGAFGKLMAWAGPKGLFGPRCKIIGIYYDDPESTPASELRSDAGLVTDKPFQPDGDVTAQQIEGGEYAVATHKGPYEKLGEAWDRFYGEWLPGSGRECKEIACFEVYLNDPTNTPPEELLTEMYIALKPKA